MPTLKYSLINVTMSWSNWV